MSLRDAAEWYRRGQQQIAAGRVDDAIDSFRRATVRDRNDKRYVLALAQRPGAQRRQRRGARRAADIAGIGPGRPGHQPPTGAARGATPGRHGGAPLLSQRAVRAVARRAGRCATAGALRADPVSAHARPDQPRPLGAARAEHGPSGRRARFACEVAQLFAKAGDSGHALDQFQRALRLAPENREALAGAGQAAFQLGDYALRPNVSAPRCRPRRATSRNTRDVVDLVLSNDPLANRIGSAERRRRLVGRLLLRATAPEHVSRAAHRRSVDRRRLAASG